MYEILLKIYTCEKDLKLHYNVFIAGLFWIGLPVLFFYDFNSNINAKQIDQENCLSWWKERQRHTARHSEGERETHTQREYEAFPT